MGVERVLSVGLDLQYVGGQLWQHQAISLRYFSAISLPLYFLFNVKPTNISSQWKHWVGELCRHVWLIYLCGINPSKLCSYVIVVKPMLYILWLSFMMLWKFFQRWEKSAYVAVNMPRPYPQPFSPWIYVMLSFEVLLWYHTSHAPEGSFTNRVSL